MSIPIINDFKQPQLSKTEKAIAMLENQVITLRDWNQGLQRQIAGLLISLKITPDKFCQNTRKQEEINTFLQEAQQIETQMMKADQAKKDEQLKNIEEFKPNE
jgi:hypothetical protein